MEGGDDDGVEGFKGFFEGGEGDDDVGGGVVGVGDNVVFFEVELFVLVGDDGEVGWVDEGDDEWV